MHDYSLDPFNLESIFNISIVSQIMTIETFVSNIKVMNQDLRKLDRFDGINFTR